MISSLIAVPIPGRAATHSAEGRQDKAGHRKESFIDFFAPAGFTHNTV